MSLSKRVLSAFLVAAMCIAVLYTGNQVKEEEEKNIFDQTATLHLWYTDEALTDYLGSMAVKYSEEHGIRVIPVLQSGLELLEKINEASNLEELNLTIEQAREICSENGIEFRIDLEQM